MSRTLGMTADAVLGATVVLANGTVVEANQQEPPRPVPGEYWAPSACVYVKATASHWSRCPA